MYMYAHPGKKLNFMGNEIGQLREWSEKQEQDWNILQYPNHDSFWRFAKKLNHFYLENRAFYEMDYKAEGFAWVECRQGDSAIYAFMRRAEKQEILAVFNFADIEVKKHEIEIPYMKSAKLVFDSNWECFGGDLRIVRDKIRTVKSVLTVDLERFSGKYFLIERRKTKKKTVNPVDVISMEITRKQLVGK